MNIKFDRIKLLITAFFGFVIPVYLIATAIIYQNKASESLLELTKSEPSVSAIYHIEEAKRKNILYSADDYSLFSLFNQEEKTFRLTINKQVMKQNVMLIGFSVISLGIMFFILGISRDNGSSMQSASNNEDSPPANNPKAVNFAFSPEDFSFNVTVGSIGGAMIILGLVAVVIGGVIPNEHIGAGFPRYGLSITQQPAQPPINHTNNKMVYQPLDLLVSCTQNGYPIDENLTANLVSCFEEEMKNAK